MIPYRCLVMPGQTPVMTVFDPVAVSLLNHACAENNFKIVIHSSWVRILGGNATLKHCIEQGIKAEFFHEDAYCNENISWRYSRVSEWLSRHQEITCYCMVDDDPYKEDTNGVHIHPKDMKSRLILVNYYNGFLFKEYMDVLALLKDKVEIDPRQTTIDYSNV